MTRLRLIALLWLAALVTLPAWPVSAGDEVGTEAVQPQIVGGTEADPDEYPFVVALLRPPFDTYDDQFCGGALIDPHWVLTAAHCTNNLSPSDVKVYANDYDLRGDGDVIDVKTVINHEDFRNSTLEADVALLELATPAKAVRARGDVLIYASDNDARFFDPGTTAWVVGWGHTESFPAFPEKLREVDVPIRSDADCEAAYGGFFIDPDMMCAGYDQGGKDSCSGDSGGPLMVDTRRGRDGAPAWLHVGIVSWGFGCADPGDYGVYTRISTFAGWIELHSGVEPGGCLGFAPTHIGTGGDDVIVGTGGDDVIAAGTGHDTIRGRHGDDLICAEQGDDVVRGGPGSDVILAGPGDDEVYGAEGHDQIFGEHGSDLLVGNRGRDVLDGGGRDDVLKGGQGEDELRGGAGDDRLVGHRHPDHLDGGIGNDRLVGGPGHDTCKDGESLWRCEDPRFVTAKLPPPIKL
jgi:hypothetical protein